MAKHKRGEERRAQILDAADRLFRSQGYAATSMRQIAAEAGFGRAVSGLYNHYPNKEAIFEALLADRSPYEALLGSLQDVTGDSLEDFLRNWLVEVWPVVSQHMEFVQLVFIDIQEFEGQTLSRFLQDILPHYFALFSQIQALPDVRHDLPLPVLIRTIASVMIGYLFTEMIVQNTGATQMPIPLALGDEWLEGLVSILVRGLQQPET